MKYYAKQVPVDVQESPMFLNDLGEEYYEGLFIGGNDEIVDIGDDSIREVLDVLKEGEIYDYLDETMNSPSPWYETLEDVFDDFLPPKKKSKYSKKEIKELRDLILDYYNCDTREEDDYAADILSIVMGEYYECELIQGFGQGDWNMIWYSTEKWDDESVRAMKYEYFNLGLEFYVEDDEGDVVCGYYIHSYKEGEIEEELKKLIGFKEGKDELKIEYDTRYY